MKSLKPASLLDLGQSYAISFLRGRSRADSRLYAAFRRGVPSVLAHQCPQQPDDGSVLIIPASQQTSSCGPSEW
jgi:hypothetical protein